MVDIEIWELQCKSQRTLKRVLAASSKRPSIAIFGQSQVGKSYLVRAISKSPLTNKLEILKSNSNERKELEMLGFRFAKEGQNFDL